MKKAKRRTRATMRHTKPDNARMSIVRIEESERVQVRKHYAELEHKTKKPKR